MTQQLAIIWQGRPSQIKNLLPIIWRSILVLAFVVGFFVTENRMASYASGIAFLAMFLSLAIVVLRTACTTIVIDAARITVNTGILGRETYSLELFRIQDVIAQQAVWLRPFDIGRLVINSSDTTTPHLWLSGIPQPFVLRDSLNRAAIALRQEKGIQEVNFGRV